LILENSHLAPLLLGNSDFRHCKIDQGCAGCRALGHCTAETRDLNSSRQSSFSIVNSEPITLRNQPAHQSKGRASRIGAYRRGGREVCHSDLRFFCLASSGRSLQRCCARFARGRSQLRLLRPTNTVSPFTSTATLKN
jgi:hypothetical protein